MSDEYIDGTIEAPRLTLYRVLSSWRRLNRLRELNAPEVIIENEEATLNKALNKLYETSNESKWFDWSVFNE